MWCLCGIYEVLRVVVGGGGDGIRKLARIGVLVKHQQPVEAWQAIAQHPSNKYWEQFYAQKKEMQRNVLESRSKTRVVLCCLLMS
jgi:hypothetical protein